MPRHWVLSEGAETFGDGSPTYLLSLFEGEDSGKLEFSSTLDEEEGQKLSKLLSEIREHWEEKASHAS